MASDSEAVGDLLRAFGVPEDAIARAASRGDPLSAFFESLPVRAAADRTVSAADIEADGGTPVVHVQELVRAFGLPAPEADEPAFTPDEASAFVELWQQRDVWPLEGAVPIARLYGRLLARIAQATIQQWFTVAQPRLHTAAADERERAVATARTFNRLMPVADALLVGVHRRWLEHEAAQAAVRAAESGSAAALLSGALEVSILFCDLKD